MKYIVSLLIIITTIGLYGETVNYEESFDSFKKDLIIYLESMKTKRMKIKKDLFMINSFSYRNEKRDLLFVYYSDDDLFKIKKQLDISQIINVLKKGKFTVYLDTAGGCIIKNKNILTDPNISFGYNSDLHSWQFTVIDYPSVP